MTDSLSNKSLTQRLDAIRQIPMGHHSAGAGLPNAAKGDERETVVRDFLSQVFPAPFRFGSGAIIDGAGKTSGQLDVVVEFPFFPSFPTPGACERLYLAESVAFAIEIKSDLCAQWQQVEQSAYELYPVRRSQTSRVTFKGGAESIEAALNGGSITSRIPFVVVGFRGHKTTEALERRLRDTPNEKRPDAVLIIESGTYIGAAASANEAAGFFAFCTEATSFLRDIITAQPDFRGYSAVRQYE